MRQQWYWAIAFGVVGIAALIMIVAVIRKL
jgi:hypothetical protein